MRHWPKSLPQAALAQPVSENVQCRSAGVRSCQKRAVISWPAPIEACVCSTIFGRSDRAGREVEEQRVVRRA